MWTDEWIDVKELAIRYILKQHFYFYPGYSLKKIKCKHNVDRSIRRLKISVEQPNILIDCLEIIDKYI